MTSDTPRDEFEWAPQPWGLVLRTPALSAVADHFFTTRQLRLRGPGADERDWALVARAIGVAPERLLRPKQVHGHTVVVVPGSGEAGPFSPGRRPAADAVITSDPSCALAVQTADCVPLLVGDPRSGAVGAVHAGWRGIASRVIEAAIAALGAHFGSRPADLTAALGPSIGPCCYAVGQEVVDAVRRAGHDPLRIDRWFVGRAAGGYRMDLWTAARDQLSDAGLLVDRVHTCRLCTAHDTGRFFSYRAEGGGTGRLAAVIRARG
jgi:YfiH family protein